jgi:hypothetical protein
VNLKISIERVELLLIVDVSAIGQRQIMWGSNIRMRLGELVAIAR